MRALVIALFLVCGLISTAHATAQVGDFLDFEGKRVEMYSTPLEKLFKNQKERPKFESTSSACWRGYIGLWKIENDTLYLISLHTEDWDQKTPLGEVIPLSFVFPKEEKKSPVEAKWFTGELRIPQGKQLRYIHSRFTTIYERDRFLIIKDGKVTGSRVVDNKGVGETQSDSDLRWVGMADEPVKDNGEWVDARNLFMEPTLEKILAGESVTTRGIFFPKSDEQPAMLWVMDSPTTEAVRFEVGKIPETPEIANGSHVEVIAKFNKESEAFDLEKIRELDPGESMHHPDFTVPEPAEVKPIREFPIKTIELLGRELHLRDSLAAEAFDLLPEKHPEAKKMRFGGWITEITEDAGKVYLLKATDNGIKQGYVAVFPFNEKEPTIESHLDKALPKAIEARYAARLTAIKAIPGFYDRPYNFEVLDDPDGDGFLVYSLASTSDANEIVIGGHSRVTVSADGKTAESVDALFKSLLILSKDEPQGEVVAAVMSHVVSPTPVETHVFQSLLHKRQFMVITGEETHWMIKEGKITKVDEKAKPIKE